MKNVTRWTPVQLAIYVAIPLATLALYGWCVDWMVRRVSSKGREPIAEFDSIT